jgi:hypothetical protein
MKIEGDKVIFDSGRERYAHCGIIGLSPELSVSEGYDGGFWHEAEKSWRDDTLTPEELLDLALYMIGQWQEFLRKHWLPHRGATDQPKETRT